MHCQQSHSIIHRSLEQLLLWRALNGYAYLTMLLDCAADGSQYGVQPNTDGTGVTIGLWNSTGAVAQYRQTAFENNVPYTCFTFNIPLAQTCNPSTSSFSLITQSCQ